MLIIGQIFLVCGILSLVVGCAQRLIPFFKGKDFVASEKAAFLQPLSFLRLSYACLLVSISVFVLLLLLNSAYFGL